MFDIIKQSVFAGLGLASLAKDKAEELVTEISRRSKLSEAEATEFRDELMRRRDTAKHELEAAIDHRIDHALIQLGILKAGIKKASEEGSHELKSFIDARIDEALQRAGIARTEDIQSLTERVERLEHHLSSGQQ